MKIFDASRVWESHGGGAFVGRGQALKQVETTSNSAAETRPEIKLKAVVESR